MTDIAKALTFATHCLKWTQASILQHPDLTLITDGGPVISFNPMRQEDLEAVLTEFLGTSYFIQVNRGTTSLFHWRVIVGWQDGTDKSVSTDHAVGVGEDLWDAIFDACVAATQLGAAA